MSLQMNLRFFQNPFETDIELLAPEMENINLQGSDISNNKLIFVGEFYKSLPLVQFDNLHKFAPGLFSVFGTPYLCEEAFCKMNYTMNVYKSKLTNEHNLLNIF